MSKEINNSYRNDTFVYASAEKNSIQETTAKKQSTDETKIKYKTVSDYSAYLREKYNYINGQTSMQGVPVTVTVSDAFLKKCLNDPEKMKFLEENLKVIPDCVKSAVNFTKTMPGNPVMTYAAYSIDANGNISCMSGCTNDPDGKIARENAKRRAKEKKAEEEKAVKKRKEKKAQEKEAENRRAEKKAAIESQYTIAVKGKNAESVTQSLVDKINSSGMFHWRTGLTGFDTRA